MIGHSNTAKVQVQFDVIDEKQDGNLDAREPNGKWFDVFENQQSLSKTEVKICIHDNKGLFFLISTYEESFCHYHFKVHNVFFSFSRFFSSRYFFG